MGGVAAGGMAESCGGVDEGMEEGEEALGMSREMSKKGSSVTEVNAQEAQVTSLRRVPLKMVWTRQLHSPSCPVPSSLVASLCEDPLLLMLLLLLFLLLL